MRKAKQPPADDSAPLSGVNVIPVIDVSLVLLIILLATSPMLNNPGFQVTLPKAVTAESKEKNISVSLSLKGEMGVNDTIVTPETLVPVLHKELSSPDKKNILVIIRADEGIKYGQVEQVMEMAKQAGATRIAVATQQKVEEAK